MRKYETYQDFNNTGRYKFIGWYPMLNEDFCIETKVKTTRNVGTFVYKTYKLQDGHIERYKYGDYIKE